jgi:hypothetical protein
VTKGSIRGTMPSSIVRAIASRHVAPAIAMLQLSSPSRSSCSAVIKGREGSRKRNGQNEGQGGKRRSEGEESKIKVAKLSVPNARKEQR